MDTSSQRFIDYSTLPSLPAQPARARHRQSAWLIGIWVTLGVTVGGAVLGPVLGVVLLDLSPLYPLNVVLGLVVGGTVGLALGVVGGVVTGLVVAAGRASRRDVVDFAR